MKTWKRFVTTAVLTTAVMATLTTGRAAATDIEFFPANRSYYVVTYYLTGWMATGWTTSFQGAYWTRGWYLQYGFVAQVQQYWSGVWFYRVWYTCPRMQGIAAFVKTLLPGFQATTSVRLPFRSLTAVIAAWIPSSISPPRLRTNAVSCGLLPISVAPLISVSALAVRTSANSTIRR